MWKSNFTNSVYKKLQKLQKKLEKVYFRIMFMVMRNYYCKKIIKSSNLSPKRYKQMFDFILFLRKNYKIDICKKSQHLQTLFNLIAQADSIEIDYNIFTKVPDNYNGKSVLFIDQNYYQHYYIAKALRELGYDAWQVQKESINHPYNIYYHGFDIYLHNDDPKVYQHNIMMLFKVCISGRFKVLWFYSRMSSYLFSQHLNYGANVDPLERLDLLFLKFLGIKFGWSPSGCLDEISQSAYYKVSSGVCEKCVCFDMPNSCSDKLNSRFRYLAHTIYDIIDNGSRFIIPGESDLPIYSQEPLTFATNTDLWHPDLEVPEKFKIKKEPNTLLILHSHGNFATRHNTKRTGIKGTHSVFAAEQKLKSNGYPVQFYYCFDVDSKDMKYYQVQADVIIDQLNLGTYGATSRESLSLGKPTICWIHPTLIQNHKDGEFKDGNPYIVASEETLYDVLVDLINNPNKLKEIGKKSREHALKWYSTESCARRLDEVYMKML